MDSNQSTSLNAERFIDAAREHVEWFEATRDFWKAASQDGNIRRKGDWVDYERIKNLSYACAFCEVTFEICGEGIEKVTVCRLYCPLHRMYACSYGVYETTYNKWFHAYEYSKKKIYAAELYNAIDVWMGKNLYTNKEGQT